MNKEPRWPTPVEPETAPFEPIVYDERFKRPFAAYRYNITMSHNRELLGRYITREGAERAAAKLQTQVQQ